MLQKPRLSLTGGVFTVCAKNPAFGATYPGEQEKETGYGVFVEADSHPAGIFGAGGG